MLNDGSKKVGIDDVYGNLEHYITTKKKESVNSVWWYDGRYGT